MMEELIVNLACIALVWLSGFLAGRYARRGHSKPPVEQSPGTQTYSAEREAERIIMEAMR